MKSLSPEDRRLRFLASLARMSEQSQRHLLGTEVVAELRELRMLATGETLRIIAAMLGALDRKHVELRQRLGFEEALEREVFDPEISDLEYFQRRCDYHEIRRRAP